MFKGPKEEINYDSDRPEKSEQGLGNAKYEIGNPDTDKQTIDADLEEEAEWAEKTRISIITGILEGIKEWEGGEDEAYEIPVA